jgi:tRNA modification GTPase
VNPRDTIVAVSTPPGRGAIGLVRLSGELVADIAQQLLRPAARIGGLQLLPRHAHRVAVVDSAEQLIDDALATLFPAPNSFTGETVLEIAAHGSPVILRAIVERALALGARLAGPGEFTLRAFLRGRVDLAQAEAIGNIINATTLYQARVAAQQAGGSLSRRLRPIKEQLLELMALLEAGIDFADNDIDVAPTAELLARLDAITALLDPLLRSYQYGRVVNDGLRLALVGRPNTGKSSLFNQLLREDRAIVTDIPGTTRDLISESFELNGIPVRLMDTAGIRESNDQVESLGIERSREALRDADVTLVVVDASQALSAEDETLQAEAAAAGRWLLVANKSDQPRRAELSHSAVAVSASTGAGIEELRAAILATALPEGGHDQQGGFLTSLRHAQLLSEARAYLAKARQAVEDGIPHEMVMLDLRFALDPIDGVTGATTADDLLNRIFSGFCIGK